MKQIIIHIGYFKTGTTALQDFCHYNDKLLVKNGILFPQTFRNIGLRNHSFLAFFICDELEIVKPWWVEEWFQSTKKRHSFDKLKLLLRTEIEKSDCNTVFLSSEELVRLGQKKGQRGIETLKSIFEGHDVKILCCLRRQDDYVDAFYNFLIKEGVRRPHHKKDLDTFIRHFHNYSAMLRFWDEVFGVQNILIKIYPSNVEKIKMFLPDVLSGIGFSQEIFENARIEAKNVSIDNRYIEFLRCANDFYREHEDILGCIRRDIVELSDKNRASERNRVALLDPVDRDYIMQNVAHVNDEICKRYSISHPLFDPDVRPRSYVKNESIAEYDLEIYDVLLKRHSALLKKIDEKISFEAIYQHYKKQLSLKLGGFSKKPRWKNRG